MPEAQVTVIHADAAGVPDEHPGGHPSAQVQGAPIGAVLLRLHPLVRLELVGVPVHASAINGGLPLLRHDVAGADGHRPICAWI